MLTVITWHQSLGAIECLNYLRSHSASSPEGEPVDR